MKIDRNNSLFFGFSKFVSTRPRLVLLDKSFEAVLELKMVEK